MSLLLRKRNLSDFNEAVDFHLEGLEYSNVLTEQGRADFPALSADSIAQLHSLLRDILELPIYDKMLLSKFYYNEASNFVRHPSSQSSAALTLAQIVHNDQADFRQLPQLSDDILKRIFSFVVVLPVGYRMSVDPRFISVRSIVSTCVRWRHIFLNEESIWDGCTFKIRTNYSTFSDALNGISVGFSNLQRLHLESQAFDARTWSDQVHADFLLRLNLAAPNLTGLALPAVFVSSASVSKLSLALGRFTKLKSLRFDPQYSLAVQANLNGLSSQYPRVFESMTELALSHLRLDRLEDFILPKNLTLLQTNSDPFFRAVLLNPEFNRASLTKLYISGTINDFAPIFAGCPNLKTLGLGHACLKYLSRAMVESLKGLTRLELGQGSTKGRWGYIDASAMKTLPSDVWLALTTNLTQLKLLWLGDVFFQTDFAPLHDLCFPSLERLHIDPVREKSHEKLHFLLKCLGRIQMPNLRIFKTELPGRFIWKHFLPLPFPKMEILHLTLDRSDDVNLAKTLIRAGLDKFPDKLKIYDYIGWNPIYQSETPVITKGLLRRFGAGEAQI